ncbi:hypothetical protein AB0K00_30320 [Dactylosporangium sp. NPDC049525]|uniref:hypothetical protein n=1 Tax=Dactylosporangium sp. NPDC049525 TaxID=3154730 RepID=UPI00341FF133
MSTVRRAEAFIVLAAVRDVEGFELDLAARTLAAGWGGDVPQLLEATAGIMALRAAADGTDPALLAGRYPQLGYLLAVERALAGHGVAVLCRELDRPELDLRGRLVLDLPRAVGAHPATWCFAIEWGSDRGWSTVIEPAGNALPPGGQRSWHWFDGLLPAPDAVADRVVRHLDGDLTLPGRRPWRCHGTQLLAALGEYPAPAAVPDVPTVCRSDPGWRPEAFRRRLLCYEPPPVPSVGAEVHLPGLPGDRRRVVAVVPGRPGDVDLFLVRLAGQDFLVSWDDVWPHLSTG